MCCRWCELPLVPLLTAPAAIISVVSMSAKAWLDGYLGDGSLFLRLSPWYLCVADCKDCDPHDPASHQRVCFWMRDWESTGFGILSTVQHLEYWCLGALILSIFPSFVACLDRRSHHCPFDCRRPAILLLIAACILSVASLSVFGSHRHRGLTELANGHYLETALCWPFHLRLVGTALVSVAAVLAIIHECRVQQGDYDDIDDDEKIKIVAIRDDDMLEDFTDYGDPL